ncbi:hypothetical protein FKW77_010508 [Venturia effusa]|uniref:Uncharacterized protein n=1 Tax=Venturia effusa TaxID=50376 RepID=A0A517KXT4_9PEZI|nr:hypothetical protein FKW77_010508 [Venturia effusa]
MDPIWLASDYGSPATSEAKPLNTVDYLIYYLARKGKTADEIAHRLSQLPQPESTIAEPLQYAATPGEKVTCNDDIIDTWTAFLKNLDDQHEGHNFTERAVSFTMARSRKNRQEPKSKAEDSLEYHGRRPEVETRKVQGKAMVCGTDEKLTSVGHELE